MIKQLSLLILLIVLLWLLPACAVNDVPTTPPPLITLESPPTPVFAGSCDMTRVLETWLQKSSFMKVNFLQLITDAAEKSVNISATVRHMANERDAASSLQIPDCAVEAHLLLVDAMTQAVEVFQAYNNGDRKDLGNILEDTQNRLDMVTVIQDELAVRLEAQYGE
jgi:hypothetical protein